MNLLKTKAAHKYQVIIKVQWYLFSQMEKTMI